MPENCVSAAALLCAGEFVSVPNNLTRAYASQNKKRGAGMRKRCRPCKQELVGRCERAFTEVKERQYESVVSTLVIHS